MHQSHSPNLAVSLILLVGCVLGLGMTPAYAATEEEIALYRKIWNPFSAGPQLVSSADVQPKGQYFFRPYVYSEIGYGQFGNTWSPLSRSLSQQLSAINPQMEFSYGITNSVEFEMYVSEVSWWQSAGGNTAAQNGHGLGDTTMFLKYRATVQQPDTWWPILTNAFYVSLPTSDWAGTPSIPGGFAPPSSDQSATRYFGDIFQYRLAFEHFLVDAKGFAYAIEVLGLNGLPFRLDGHVVNAKPGTFGLVGVQPTIEYKFTDQIVTAEGVLFTLAGQNDVAAIYPNFSIYFYWSRSGRVIAR
jgi:hypothetical protein